MHPALARDRVAVITGAASGIGRAAARKLATLGMRVVLADLDRRKLPKAEVETVAAAGGDARRVTASPVDVADADAMKALARRVETLWEPPSLLMNNAASFARASTLDSPMLWRQIFDTNLFGPLNGIAAFLPGMLAGGGRRMIVNTGSKQGITLPPGNSGYDASKAALNAYTQLLSHDLRSRPGCTVTAHLLVPGWTTNGDNPHKPGAWLPEQVVDFMLAALKAEQFWIVCPDGETSAEMDRRRMLWHAHDPIKGRPALSRWHADFKEEFDAWMTRDLPEL